MEGESLSDSQVAHKAVVGSASSKAAAVAAARVVAQGSYGPTGSWSASWYYLDSIGQSYGPLESCEMCRLFGEGRFPTGGDLFVRLGDWQWYVPLHIVFPDLTQAFVVPPTWPQCISLPEAQLSFGCPSYSLVFDSDFYPWRDALRDEWWGGSSFLLTSQDHRPLSGQTAVSDLISPTHLPSGDTKSFTDNRAEASGSCLNPTATWFHPAAGSSRVRSERMHFLRTSCSASCARRSHRRSHGTTCGERRASRGGEAWCVGASTPGAPRHWGSRAARPKR